LTITHRLPPMTTVAGVTRSTRMLSTLTTLTALALAACGRDAPAAVRGGDVDFGIVVQGKKLEHTFLVRNDKTAPVTIARVDGCPFCAIAPFDSVIPPGKDARIAIAIDTKDMRGPLGQRVQVALREPGVAQPRVVYFRVRGGVVFPYELTPDNRVYFFGVEGEPQRDTVLLTNHREKPLKILGISSDNPRITAQQVTYERGRRYRFDVALPPGLPSGSHRAKVRVRTDSPDLETFVIHVLASLDRVVDTSPHRVYYATIPLARIAESKGLREKTVIVKKYRGKDFQVVRATVDNPMFDVSVEPKTAGESYYVRVTLSPKRAKKGVLAGTLTIETNDPAAPKFTLPITGTVV
jgi:uncharacterized protein DUF1573